jgi:large subunit ribosomal protein L28
MARVCQLCGRRTVTGMMISRRGLPKRDGGVGLKTTGYNKRRFKPNLQKVRALVDGKVTRVKVCTRCIKAGRVTKPVLAPARVKQAG